MKSQTPEYWIRLIETAYQTSDWACVLDTWCELTSRVPDRIHQKVLFKVLKACNQKIITAAYKADAEYFI